MRKLKANDVMENESELVIHDFGNLSSQVIRVSSNFQELENEAERMNQLFTQGGHSNFKAEVLKDSVPVYRWQVDGRFNK